MLPVPFVVGAAVGGLVSWSARRRTARRERLATPAQLAQLTGEALEQARLLHVLRVEPLRGGRAVDIHGRLASRGGPLRAVVRAFAAGRATEIDVENLRATAVIAGAPVAVLVSRDGFTRAARANATPETILLEADELSRVGAGWSPSRLGARWDAAQAS